MTISERMEEIARNIMGPAGPPGHSKPGPPGKPGIQGIPGRNTTPKIYWLRVYC